jgi:hypothetical protein
MPANLADTLGHPQSMHLLSIQGQSPESLFQLIFKKTAFWQAICPAPVPGLNFSG